MCYKASMLSARSGGGRLAIAVCLLLLVAVTGSASGCGQSATGSMAQASCGTEPIGPSDPLASVIDPTDYDFVAEGIQPVVHESGRGPASFVVDRPDGAQAIRFIVTCVPDSYFAVTMGTFFAGYCGRQIQNSGEFPLDDSATLDQPLEILLDISPGASYWLLGIPIEEQIPGGESIDPS